MSYKGSRFFGWQKQPKHDQPSVQGELEGVLATLFQKPIRVIGSGRTDRGVHALAQTAHFDLEEPLTHESAQELVYKLNRLTPQELYVFRLESVPPKFHAQLWTQSKTYKYLVRSGPFPHPLSSDLIATVPFELQVDRLNEAAKVFLGEHDFKSFQTSGTEVPSTVRTVITSEWKDEGGYLSYTICGNGFLKQMVRNLVGQMLHWAEGDEGAGKIRQILEAKDRRLSAPSAAPHGLYLCQVDYGKSVDEQCSTLVELPALPLRLAY
jgi:tRNA pseudouridine38-40 synthase